MTKKSKADPGEESGLTSPTDDSAPELGSPEADRALLYSMLGDLPDRQASIASTTIDVEEREGYVLERLLLDLNTMEPVPAYFVRPAKKLSHYPTILYSHAHGDDFVLGKDELLRGRKDLAAPPYAEVLTAQGYAVLAIDHWNFGERRGRAESALFKELLWKGKVLFGLMVYDCLRAVDYLVSRSDVDASRIGALGMSLGSTLSWWTAALDARIAAVADICCLTDFNALIERGALDGHGIYYFVPGLLKHFTTARIQALICPRPHLSLAGIHDPLTPPEGLDRIDRQMKQVYGHSGAPGAWHLSRHHCGHLETTAMRAEVVGFLKKWLA